MFYLIPPRGNSILATLEQDIETRFKFLVKLIQLKGDATRINEELRKLPNFCSNFDCLIEGSKRDCASHFLFRLACKRSGHIQDYWIMGEKELFLFRMKTEEESLYNTLTKFLNNIRKVLSALNLTELHKELLSQIFHLLYPVVYNSDIAFCKFRNACSHSIHVPWIFVQELVATREIHIQKGIATVPCYHFITFLASIYKMLLEHGIKQLHIMNIQTDDPRIVQLIKNIHYYFLKLNDSNNLNHSKDQMKHEDVDEEVSYFPLCMQQLHMQLKKTRRLNHSERFRYSLFLKDIGLPLQENILFWKHYYSMNPRCNTSGCQHLWEGTSAKKYEYSFRHMYGREGKRFSYCSHTCSALQAVTPQPQGSGGCPFKHLEHHLLSSMISMNERIWPVQRESILKAVKEGNSSLACGLYLSGTLHKHIPQPLRFRRFSSYSSNEITKSRSSLIKISSCQEVQLNSENSDKFSCIECSYKAVNPEMGFLSPNNYFFLSKYKQL